MDSLKRVAAEKAAARERFRRLRAILPASEHAAVSEAIVRRLLALPEVADARVLLAYWPLPGEIDLRPLIHRFGAKGRTVALPVTGRTLTPRRFESDVALVAGPFGTREPDASSPAVPPEAVDVVIVPGLAMGRDGTRLGYGGGYYDAFLPTTPALRLGVVRSGALVDTLPVDAHDARLDVIVTETDVLRPEAVPRNPTGPDA